MRRSVNDRRGSLRRVHIAKRSSGYSHRHIVQPALGHLQTLNAPFRLSYPYLPSKHPDLKPHRPASRSQTQSGIGRCCTTTRLFSTSSRYILNSPEWILLKFGKEVERLCKSGCVMVIITAIESKPYRSGEFQISRIHRAR